MKKINRIITISLILVCVVVNEISASDTHSGQSVTNGVKSGSHASASAAHSILASGQVSSAVMAVPFAIVDSVAKTSNQISKNLVDSTNRLIESPLEITEESFVVGPPPNKALNIYKQ